MNRIKSRYVADPGAARYNPDLDMIDKDELLLRLLNERVGNTGTLVHSNLPDLYEGTVFAEPVCPFCGCRSRISFCGEPEDKQGMDVFECLCCLATITRYDVIGKVEWDAMQKRQKERDL